MPYRLMWMPIIRPTAADPPGCGLADYLWTLVGCLLLALPMCMAIVLYTNHVKEVARMDGQVADFRAPAAATIGTNDLPGAAALENGSVAQSRNLRVTLSSREVQPVGVPAAQQGAPVYGETVGPAERTILTSKRISRKLIRPAAAGSSTTLTFSQGWSRANYPSHAKAALIGSWHQSLKRQPNAKAKSGTRS